MPHALSQCKHMSSFEQALAQAADPSILPIDAFHARRSLVIRNGMDIANLAGAEIGALSDPLICKSDGPVLYVDHIGTEELRAKYSIVAGFDVTRILPVDIALRGQTLSEALKGQKLDYIIASHVLEHVPNLVGWLSDIRDCLSLGGPRGGGNCALFCPTAAFPSTRSVMNPASVM